MSKIPGCLVAIIALLSGACAALAGDDYALYESDNDFETVMDGAKLAIEERGMYINNLMHMDEMLERTGRDLGMDEKIFEKAASIEFCSAVLSRRMTSEDPRRIVNCPFIISVYVLPTAADKTFLAYRRVPEQEVRSSQVMAEVADMLQGVAESAISW